MDQPQAGNGTYRTTDEPMIIETRMAALEAAARVTNPGRAETTDRVIDRADRERARRPKPPPREIGS